MVLKNFVKNTFLISCLNLKNFKNRMNKGFTLSEVLITLGVIGVIAALTIPICMANYKRKTYENGYKEAISLLTVGFFQAMADEHVDDLTNTSLWDKCDNEFLYPVEWTAQCSPELEKIFNIMMVYSREDLSLMGDNSLTSTVIDNSAECNRLVGNTSRWWALNSKTKCVGESNLVYILENGMKVDMAIGTYVYKQSGNIFAGYGMVDINGDNGPNMVGRDAFYFAILPDARVVGYTSYPFFEKKFKAQGKDFESKYKQIKPIRDNYCKSADDKDMGLSCSGMMYDNAWIMDY